MTKKIVILGTGGNCIDILDAINEINSVGSEKIYECVGFLDDNTDNHGRKFYDVEVISNLESASEFSGCYFVNGIGSHSNFWKKEQIIEKIKVPVERFETIIHPTASVSKMSSLGYGTVILQNVTVASNVSIGNHVIILPNSIISHDDVIEDYTCITGGVCISGGVSVGKSSYLGTNSTIIGNIKIGVNCLVGMGSTVLKDVEDNSVVVGNPARFLRKTI